MTLFNLPERYRFSSLGAALPSLKVRIADSDSRGEGEIVFWGRNAMMGYLNRPDKTKEMFDKDGWVRSGDLGRKDKQGYVYLTGTDVAR